MLSAEHDTAQPASIPHVFHYCWFGGNPKPELLERCIASWTRVMPGWDVVEWNEDNYDVGKNAYMREAHEAGAWAFASDYARFDIVNTHGGVYLDTDVELLKPIPASVLADEAFTGIESAGRVAPGLIYGSVPGHPFLSEMLESYEGAHFLIDGRPDLTPMPRRITAILEGHGYRQEDVLQKVAGVTIYPSEVFCGFDMDVREPNVTENTISTHHYAGTWAGKRGASSRRLRTLIKRVVGIRAYRTLLSIKRRFFGIRGA
ncbi:MAG TPA: glycosyltransferase [Coriobacteriia bacterium]|nr:glycosyltransferase [Coriobacteriia bacterium]